MNTSYPWKTEDKWLLAIIGLVPYVEGKTRLQKFGILSFHKVLRDEEFFDDWEAHDYGGFSSRLDDSLDRLEKHDYVRSRKVAKVHGKESHMYVLTNDGKDTIRDFAEKHSSKLKEIRSLIHPYFQQPLEVLLRDVYQAYPELATNSQIKARVNRSEEGDLHTSPEYGVPVTDKSEEAPTTVPRQHVFEDEDSRERLAKSIGLDRIPDLDPRAFGRIEGILAELADAEGFDPMELVREVRGS